MSWIAVVWPMMGASSLTLGLLSLLVWSQQRARREWLMFGVAASSLAALTLFEMLLSLAPTPAQYARLLRWADVPATTMMVGLVYFVLLYFHAGRPWLAFAVGALRTTALAANFTTGATLDHRTITALGRVNAWADASIALPAGIVDPWVLLWQLSNLAMALFMVDVILTVSRRREPDQVRRATLVCGSIAVFALLTNLWTAAVVMRWVHGSLTVSIAFFLVLLVTSHELVRDAINAGRITRQIADSSENLRISEQDMRLAAHAAGLGLWTWNLDANEFRFTETGSILMGLAPDQRVSPENLLTHIHPEDHPVVEQARNEAVRGSGEYACEYRVLMPDGNVRWVAARGRLEHPPLGAPLHIRGLVLDVTERRKAEERFRRVIDGAPTAMLIIDRTGTIILANAQAGHVFGYGRAELVGQNVDMLVPDASRVGHAGRRDSFAARPQMRAMGAGRELSGRRKDGSEIRVEIGLTPIETAEGLCFLASVTDISERLRLEQEAALQRDELAHLSRVTLLGEMAGSLAHELNQPLTAILSNAQAALRFLQHDRPDMAELHDSLTDIVENDKRASEVIRRMRAMLRKDQANYQPLSINDVVSDVLRLINSDLLNRNVNVSLELTSVLPPIYGDRVQLQQVLLNLVMNACDAMDKVVTGRRLSLRTQIASGCSVEVLVSDVGRGIADSELEAIFTPFVTTKPEGVGLGLTICRTIIQAHRGTLWASNNAAEGATLHFRLPVWSGGSA